MLDLGLVVFVVAYAYRGWRRGLLREVLELVGLALSIVLAYLLTPLVGDLFDALLGIGPGWAIASAGLLLFAAFYVGALVAANKIAGRTRARYDVGGRAIDGAGGTLFAGTWSLVLVSATLLIAVTVPGLRARAATPVCDSTVARFLVSHRNPLEPGGTRLAAIGRPALLWLDQALSGGMTLGHLGGLCARRQGVEEGTSGITFPPVGPEEVSVARQDEARILALLNRARVNRGLDPLDVDPLLRDAGRAHARDMYLRGYFAHDTPQCSAGEAAPGCLDPFDRLRAAGVRYITAGENLALAPNAREAHSGLMESPGHRANILREDYSRVGIGVYRGPYGLMVAQEFAG